MKSGVKYYIHCIIGILIMLVFRFISPFGPVTEVGVKVLGVFLGTMYLWTFVDTLWPSLFGVLMLGLTGFGSFNGLLSSTFGNPIVIMLFFVIMLTGAITEEGICEYISRWFITRRINNGRPWVFTAMLLLGVYLLSVLTAPSPTIFIFWPILYSLFAVIGYKQGDRYVTLMLISVVMAASFGFATTPFKGALPGLLGNYAKVTGTAIEYLPYMVTAAAISLTALAAIVLLMRFVLKPDVTPLKQIDASLFDKNPLPPMNLRQKSLSFALLFFIIWVLAPSLFPEGALQQLLKDTQNAIPVFIITVCCLIHVDKKPLVNFKTIVSKYMIWSVVLIVGSALTIGNALTDEATGITVLLKQILTPVFEGQSPLVFTITIVVIACVLTNICNNMVVGMLLIPIIHVFSQQIGAGSAAIACLSMYMVCIAVVTPAASTTSAILHGNTKWLKIGDIYKYGILMSIISLIAVLAVGLPIANIFFS